MTSLTWMHDAGTPNYTSGCGHYVAIYARTSGRGFGIFRVYRSEWPLETRRRVQNALSVGGLPRFAFWERDERL